MKPTRTIALRATPPGEGAIHSIWLLGPESEMLLSRVFLSSRRIEGLSYGRILWEGESLDEAMVRKLDRSEFAVPCGGFEIFLHGSMSTAERVLEIICSLGAQKADSAGPWIQELRPQDRCSQEALELLCVSKTREAALFFLAQAQGLLKAWRDETLDLIGRGEIDQARGRVRAILESAVWGISLSSPKRIVIAGKPNAGKSTLFNAWVGFERVIVSGIEGTTRDPVREGISVHGYPFELIDTAGFRESSEGLERLSIQESERSLQEADLLVWIHDVSVALDPRSLALFQACKKPKILLLNKQDLNSSSGQIPLSTGENLVSGSLLRDPQAVVSELSRLVLHGLQFPSPLPQDRPAVFTLRQRTLLEGPLETALKSF